MFPRNIRTTHAWKIAQILSLFEGAIREGSTKEEIEKGFIKNLKIASLQKSRALNTRDKDPGDFRTYRTQLSAFGLIFESQDGIIDFTKAGRDILKGLSPIKVLQSQVFRHQYPSCYSNSSQVKIDKGINLRPFVVILRLLLDSRLNGYITNAESAIPVGVGKTESDHEKLVAAVLELRGGSAIEDVTQLKSLYTIRISQGELKLAELMNIGNTFLNVLIGTRLIEKDTKASKSIKYRINPEYQDQILEACKTEFTSIKNPELNESFQRAYGAWDGKKDTEKRNWRVEASSESPKNSLIKAAYFTYQEDRGIQLTSNLPKEFVNETKAHYGFTEIEIKNALESFLNFTRDDDEREFLRIAQGGVSTALSFEKKIRAIFENNFSIQAYHTGQRKRKTGVGGFPDVLLLFKSPAGCIILDAKSTAKYDLPAQDYRAMADYCRHYTELGEVHAGSPLLAAGFVSTSFSEGVTSRLRDLSSETGIPIFTLQAQTILSWIQSGKKDPEILASLLNKSSN